VVCAWKLHVHGTRYVVSWAELAVRCVPEELGLGVLIMWCADRGNVSRPFLSM
jgi:hypothetical protein